MSGKVEGLPVSGYRPQTPEAIETVNALKDMEEHVLRLLDEVAEDRTIAADGRWLAIGRTMIEQGLMAANRAIFKPERIALPEEDDPVIEAGWVLERADSDTAAPLYYAPCGGHGEQWSHNHLKALRLARREDGEALAEALAIEVRVAEHEWS
ncbi:hypothetical protein FQ775_01035 [Nitratireductor mangrovi]|uniref:Acb2/Tad1 hairpin domain-containing protein n=1 Tax=Nitratireductor mangrovi TaxID=2599600 RepID=A0A5B8KTW3_9HYPH|nr:hypothetical protein [Nitratireductor mangrovi]QDY99066.1 hypothetical protein FQ775_01035 [Nitratireductor mangrovi]